MPEQVTAVVVDVAALLAASPLPVVVHFAGLRTLALKMVAERFAEVAYHIPRPPWHKLQDHTGRVGGVVKEENDPRVSDKQMIFQC